MPDILTHLASTYLLVRTPNLYKNKLLQFLVDFRPIIYLGAILPDLMSKPLQFMSMKLYNFSLALHSPFCVLIGCFIISQYFYTKDKKKTFFVLFIFSFFHIFVDSLQEGINPGYQALFPFSLRRYGLNLVSSELYLYSLVAMLLMILILEVIIRLRIRKSKM